MQRLFPYRRFLEDERRLLRFEGVPNEPVEPEQGRERERQADESTESIDPENVEQEAERALNEASDNLNARKKEIADRFERTLDRVKASAQEYPEFANPELIEKMEATLKQMRANIGEQGGEKQSDTAPGQQEKEQTSPEEQAYQKFAEQLGIKPEGIVQIKEAVGKLSPGDAAQLQTIAEGYQKQPEAERNQWLAKQMESASPNVRNLIETAQKTQSESANSGGTNEKKNEFKEFGDKLAKLIEMIKKLLQDCGIIEKKEKSERKTDAADDKKLQQEVREFVTASAEKPGKPNESRTKLEGFKTRTEKHLTDANTDLKESKQQKTTVERDLQTARDEKAKLEGNTERTEEQNTRLKQVTDTVTKLEASLVEADKAVKANEARIAELTTLKTGIETALNAIPAEQKTETGTRKSQPEQPESTETSTEQPARPAESAEGLNAIEKEQLVIALNAKLVSELGLKGAQDNPLYYTQHPDGTDALLVRRNLDLSKVPEFNAILSALPEDRVRITGDNAHIKMTNEDWETLAALAG